MTCPDVVSLIGPLIDGLLEERLEQAVRDHAARCASCGQVVEATEYTQRSLRAAVERSEATPGFRERLHARLHSEFAGLLRQNDSPSMAQLCLPKFDCTPLNSQRS